MIPYLEVKNLTKCFVLHKKEVVAIDDVSFDLYPSETFGLVGESGCGKSTTGRCLLRLESPSSGQILYEGKDLLTFSPKELFHFRKKAQVIFQDPYSSLNPRMTAGEIILEPLRIHKVFKEQDLASSLYQLLDLVGLSKSASNRFPHEFSGGQRQRIGIARALALKPQFIVCDEPLSALDVSVQAQIVNLLKQLQKELGLTYFFIAHDLALVKYISDRVAVMYLGNLVEIAPADELYLNPLHPYTQVLLSSIPIPDPQQERARRPLPLIDKDFVRPLSKGCPFANRCPFAKEECHQTKPEWKEISSGHRIRCHLY